MTEFKENSNCGVFTTVGGRLPKSSKEKREARQERRTTS